MASCTLLLIASMYFHFKWLTVREAPPFSTFCVGEKIEDVLFEVIFFAVNI